MNYGIGRPVTFPGDRAEDTVKAHLEMSMECDQPVEADFSMDQGCPEPASSFNDSEANVLINEAIQRNQAADVAQPADGQPLEPIIESHGETVQDEYSDDEDLLDDEWIDAIIQKEWDQLQSGTERVKTQVRG